MLVPSSRLIDFVIQNLADSPATFRKESGAAYFPPCTAKKTAQGLSIEMSLPLCEKENISISFRNDKLTISGTSNVSVEEDEEVLFSEIPTGDFSRTFRLNKDVVDGNSIEASFDNGVLKIVVPLKQKEEQSSVIPIK